MTVKNSSYSKNVNDLNYATVISQQQNENAVLV